MNRKNKTKKKRYINSIHLLSLMTFVTILFLSTICIGQTELRQVEYEVPGILDAYKILPQDILEGEDYWVERKVVSSGFTNSYSIMSRFGQFEAQGDDMLQIRIQEIQAIATLKELKKSSEFGEAVKKAATSPIKGAKALITNPVDTISGIPKGVGRFFSRVGEMVTGKRGEQEEGITKELIGFSKVKRQYAHELGVDVYSSNEVLQKELNSVSWAGFAGGVGVSLAMLPIRGASEVAYISIRATQFTHSMNQLLLDNAPEDLRKINREKLKEMGVEESVIKEFLIHPKYSPRHKTILVHALAEMDGAMNREQFIRQALFAEYEEEAFLFQRVAEMMYGYHIHVNPIKEIIPVRKLAVGYTADHAIVAAIPIDYLYWTERADFGSEAMMSLESSQRPVKKIELWITGQLTPRAREELHARGFIVKEKAGGILMPSSAAE